MKIRDMMVIAGVAVATTAAAIALWPTMPTALAESKDEPRPPTLEVQGVVLTIQTDEASCKAGHKPVVRVTARNPSNKPVDVDATVVMTTTAPASRFARMLPMPTKVWSRACKATLAPNETRTFKLQADVAVAKEKMVSFTLQSGGKMVRVTPTTPLPVKPELSTGKVPKIQSRQ